MQTDQTGDKSACVEPYLCLTVSEDASSRCAVPLVHETGIQLYFNGHRVLQTQCMACDLELMAVGFFVGEGLLRQRDELQSVQVDITDRSIRVSATVPEERIQHCGSSYRLASGGSRTRVIDAVQEQADTGFRIVSDKRISASDAIRLGTAFNEFEGLYRDTRFVHSAALSDGVHILYHAEDVGRHNAVDKVIGFGFLHGIDFSQAVLLCSGRFSLEMVAKAARVGIPVYVSPAAPSIEAVTLAERIGMCLIGRVRADSAYVYSALHRIAI
ncbi:MAG: formate dehydrogenase accessory sulfurtransferase FdhD [Desulfobacterota bacterium]|nr:formate dehydrogenase accessory sulfurtransferase FdhD [Thermodesulfobacteriota bacterium]